MDNHQLAVWVVAAVVVIAGMYLFFRDMGDVSAPKKQTVKTEQAVSTSDSTSNVADTNENEAMTSDGGAVMEEKATSSEQTTGAGVGGSSGNAGSYVAYAPEKVSSATGDVVLFFRATWCPTCKVLHEDILANASAIPSGLVILDVDYDNSSSLKQLYGVTYQHTLVQVNSSGSLLKKWSGTNSLAALVAQVI